VTGFLPAEEIDARFGKSALVIAPFRETSGSGSLVQALGRKAAVLASDLPLNREIAEREPGSLAFFRSEDPDDLAKEAIRLLEDSAARKALSEAAGRYGSRHSPELVAAQHFELYRSCQVEAKT
jgi:glycosyltransferase involved in cell wall biosynthesis